MASKKILMTGGAGFIGSHLADELLARGGYYRSLVDRQTRGLLPDGDASAERAVMAGVA